MSEITAVEILAKGVVAAAVAILNDRNVDLKSVDAGELAEQLKSTMKEEIAGVLDEWKDATEARMSEAFLRNMMNVQANYIAMKALKAGGFLSKGI